MINTIKNIVIIVMFFTLCFGTGYVLENNDIKLKPRPVECWWITFVDTESQQYLATKSHGIVSFTWGIKSFEVWDFVMSWDRLCKEWKWRVKQDVYLKR